MSTVARVVRDNQKMAYSLNPADRGGVERFFDGLVLVDPGLVLIDRWRPDGTEPPRPPGVDEPPFYGGVARKP
jgi:hypothetical protein